MSQNVQNPKTKIEAGPDNIRVVSQPKVRDFSTGGGHGPEEMLVEGDEQMVTKKWQGYPPDNLNIIGKPFPPMPEVALPRFTGKAQYATRVAFPNMVHIKILPSPHPRARIRTIDVSKAEKMPGVAYIMTPQNAPASYPLPEELFFQGEIVAMVAADSENLAEDAAEAIEVEYELLPFATTLAQVMAAGAPNLRDGEDNPITRLDEFGDVEKGFAEADVVKEFTYYYSGGIPIPFQPGGGVAKWDGDKLTFWGMGQGIHTNRAGVARGLGIDVSQVRYINKWNGCTLGGALALTRLDPWIAWIAKQAGRPARLMLPKDHELAQLQTKPQNIQMFKVGATKAGKITACQRTYHINTGNNVRGGNGGRSELYIHTIPQLEGNRVSCIAPTRCGTGPSRSNMQQEIKWGWEQMMDEMAEAVGMDPAEFRLLNVQKPGTKVSIAQGGPTMTVMPESVEGVLTYDCYAVRRGGGRRPEGDRLGEAERRSRRSPRTLQARHRDGPEPAPCRPCGVPRGRTRV